MKLWLAFAIALLVALFTGTSRASGQSNFSLPEGVDWRRDIIYSRVGERELKADLFLPSHGEGPWPAVVYFHGGAWRSGSRAAFRRQAAHLAAKGIAGLCVEYRLSGEAKWPAAYEDAKAAVRYLRDNARAIRVDPDRIGAAGGSAGGQLAALLGTNPESGVAAVAVFNPALDLIALAADEDRGAPSVTAYLGSSYAASPANWIAASPARHVTPKSAKFLFLHGTHDETVPYQQSVRMRDELKAAGVTAELFTAEGAGHGFFNRDPWFQPTLDRMEQFFVEHLLRRRQ